MGTVSVVAPAGAGCRLTLACSVGPDRRGAPVRPLRAWRTLWNVGLCPGPRRWPAAGAPVVRPLDKPPPGTGSDDDTYYVRIAALAPPMQAVPVVAPVMMRRGTGQ